MALVPAVGTMSSPPGCCGLSPCALPLPLSLSHCKTNYGYGAMANVSDVNEAVEDKQESYFLAETLK